MKKLAFLFAAVAVAGMVSCQKNSSPVAQDEPVQKTGVISVSIQTPTKETKAAKSSINDGKINSIQIFVFDAEGKVETSRYESSWNGSDPISVTTKTGAKTVYAILNAARQNFSTIAKLEGNSNQAGAGMEYFTNLSDNAVDNLVMSGKNTVTVTAYDKNAPGAAPQELTIRVKRLAAKVQLDKVTVDFRNTSLEGTELAIQDIYLVNVVGKSPYGIATPGTAASPTTTGLPVALPNSVLSTMTNWYSLMKLPNPVTGSPAITYDLNLGDAYKCSGDYVAGTAKTMDRVFFCYPNPATAVQQSLVVPDAPVRTSIVIKGHLKNTSTVYVDTGIDKDTYYTFDLPAIEANKVYQIKNINITMAGADQPGERVSVGKVDMSIVVDEWFDAVELNYEF